MHQYIFKTNIKNEAVRKKLERLLANDKRIETTIYYKVDRSYNLLVRCSETLTEKEVKNMVVSLGFECERIG